MHRGLSAEGSPGDNSVSRMPSAGREAGRGEQTLGAATGHRGLQPAALQTYSVAVETLEDTITCWERINQL